MFVTVTELVEPNGAIEYFETGLSIDRSETAGTKEESLGTVL